MDTIVYTHTYYVHMYVSTHTWSSLMTCQPLYPTFIYDVSNGLPSQGGVEWDYHSGVGVARKGCHGPVDAVKRIDPKMALLSKWQAYLLQAGSKVMRPLQHLAVLEELIGTLPSLPSTFAKAGAIV